MRAADDIIRSADSSTSLTDEEWTVVVYHIVRMLEAFLGASLRFDESLEKYINEGVKMDFCCNLCAAGELKCDAKGILASRIHGEHVAFGATLMFYLNNKRIISSDGRDFVDLEYRIINETGRWETVGWFKDEYGEYSEFGLRIIR